MRCPFAAVRLSVWVVRALLPQAEARIHSQPRAHECYWVREMRTTEVRYTVESTGGCRSVCDVCFVCRPTALAFAFHDPRQDHLYCCGWHFGVENVLAMIAVHSIEQYRRRAQCDAMLPRDNGHKVYLA